MYTSGPVTGLCTVHWASPDLPSSVHLKWSMALPQESVVVATNFATEKLHTNGFAWSCIVLDVQLSVVTASGVLGRVDLHFCPLVTAAAVLESRAVESANDLSAITYTAIVLLSCVGDKFFEVSLRVSRDACSVEATRERHFHAPSERTLTSQSTPRRTYTLLPYCEKLVRVSTEWLRVDADQPLPLVLIGYHAQFGMQMIVEGKFIPYNHCMPHVAYLCAFP